MSPAEKQYWLRATRRAQGLQPEISAAVLRCFQILRESLTDAQLHRLVSSGQLDLALSEIFSADIVDRAMIPVRVRIRQATEKSFKFTTADLPRGGKVGGNIAVMFNHLDPKVIEGVRALDVKASASIGSVARETIRAYVEQGLRDGVNPREIARHLRSTVGLAPNQEAWLRGFRSAASSAHLKQDAMTYELRDRRFDGLLRKARASGVALSPEQIERMAEAYRRRAIAMHAETISRTAALESFKLGQRLSWQSAIDAGIVKGDSLWKRWVTVLDGRERPHHHEMNGQVAPFEGRYSDGSSYAGEDDPWNCRCQDFVWASYAKGAASAA